MQKLGFLRHPFHILTSSPWPFVTALQIFLFLFGFIFFMHDFLYSGFFCGLGFLLLIYSLYRWGSDVVYESTILGQHTNEIQTGLRFGVVLFIVSEIMFFFSFFWTFFYSSVSPAVQIGAIWPPIGIQTIDAWSLPFLNTLLLLTSGVFATLGHLISQNIGRGHADILTKVGGLVTPNYASSKTVNFFFFLSLFCFVSSIVFGSIFTGVQVYEYLNSSFTISDGAYGSIFYMATGFHGFHVLLGTCFLVITAYRFYRGDFLGRYFLGLEGAVWYWHFVDVVWIFLFICIYWWGA